VKGVIKIQNQHVQVDFSSTLQIESEIAVGNVF